MIVDWNNLTTKQEMIEHVQEESYHDEEVLGRWYERVHEVDYEYQPITAEGRLVS